MTITDIPHQTEPETSATDSPDAVAEPDNPSVDDAGSGPDLTVPASFGELLAVDPATLVIGANVRRDVALDKAFRRSIADRGVREPIIARRRDDGVLVVRKGKRRTLAAVEVGRVSVPVLVEPGVPEDDTEPVDATGAPSTAERIDRIVDQLEENQHRAATREADEVRAHQQLLDLGLTAGQIARRTHVPAARVKLTTTVASSELATAVLDRYDLTLDQVAVIAEFDDGTDTGTDAVKALTVAAAKEPAQFEHVAQRLRDGCDDTRRHAERVGELTAAGVAILDLEQPGDAQQISGLRATSELPSGTELTVEQHADCAGHAASVEVRRGWDRQVQVRIAYWCTGPDRYGHVARWNRLTATGAGGGSDPVSGALSEEQKTERRRVITNNREWDSATTVRREWLRGFLARRTAPRDALTYVASTLGRAGHDLRRAMESGHPTACELLGMQPGGSVYAGRPSPIAQAAAIATPARATMLALAVLLGAAEDATNRQTWRNPTDDHRAYFTALRDWGYPLSPVEQLVLADPGQGGAVEPTTPADTTADHDVDAVDEPAAAGSADDVPIGDDLRSGSGTGGAGAADGRPVTDPESEHAEPENAAVSVVDAVTG